MVTYSYDQFGLLFIRFDDFTSSTIRKVEYIDGKLYIHNNQGYYYNLNFPNLLTARIQFADLVEKRINILNATNATTLSTNSDEWLIGTNAADQLSSKAGNDRIFGGAGDDTYQFTQGDGVDTVSDSQGSNTIHFLDKNIADITIQTNGSNLELKYSANDSVIVDGSVATYRFADGPTQTQDQLLLDRNLTFTGTDNSETLSGLVSNDTIWGGAGDDTLNGNAGNDTLYGQAGNDTLNGGDGDDILNGVIGNDTLRGNAGNDTYQFAKGDGIDNISDFSGTNSIVFSNVKSTDVQYYFEQGTLNIQYGTNDIVKIANFLANNRDNFSVQFSDGVSVAAQDFDAQVGVQYWIRNIVASNNVSTDFKYAFPTVKPDYVTGSHANGWAPMNSSAQEYLISRFDQISGYTGLTFSLTDNLVQSNVIAGQVNIQGDSSGYAFYPNGTTLGSDIFFASGYISDPIQAWQRYVYSHELGHALGLRHSFEGPTADRLSSSENSTKWTTMAYNTLDYTDGNFKPFDIAALQAMYGVNTSERTGNDSYQFDGTIGTLVWDGAGTDTIDASAAGQKAYINLNEGAWSYIGEKSQYISSANQLAINLGTKIENAIGGAFNDTIIGNSSDNILNGGSGADTLIGGFGDDIYYVDNVNDRVVELSNQGSDKIYSSVDYNLFGRHVEVLELIGSSNINATGNGFNNTIIGNSGNNIIDGWGGSDIMIGGLGDDTYYVDNVSDKVVELANQGIDKILSSVDYDLFGRYVEVLELIGNANINATGNGFSNTIIGNSGNNIINGWGGDDLLTGGLGSDTSIYKVIVAANATAGNGFDTWTDFKVGDTSVDTNADKIDISDLLIGYNGSESTLVNYISLNYNGENTVLSIDRDGGGSTYNYANLLTMNNINVNLSTLLDNHQLIV